MALTFTRAPTFVPGAVITSAEHITFARAFNDHLRSGVGDPTWRIHWYLAGAFRQVRTPACDFPAACQWPPNLEFEEFYVHVDPDNTNVEWPDEPPGVAGGANLGSPFMGYHFGTPGLDSEATRLNIVPLDTDGTDAGYWQLGKRQRGIYDPTTGNIAAPALSAAQSYQQIGALSGSFHLKSYGGYLPVEGGVALQFTTGNQIARLGINPFLTDFRGTAEQRENEKFVITKIAHDNQRFFTAQHFLSPNIGHMDSGELVDDYPLFTFGPAASIVSGTVTSSHQYANNFTFAGLLAVATDLESPCTLQALDGETVLYAFALSPESPSHLHYFEMQRTPNLKFRLATDATFTNAGGRIDIETAELFIRKPEFYDAMLAVRLASCGQTIARVDTRGMDTPHSKEISDNYFRRGCITNIRGATSVTEDVTAAVNGNPVFDRARRTVRDITRVVPRGQFVGYEVVDGKSILYFKRHAMGQVAQQLDSFIGIAPDSLDTEGEGIIHVPGDREFSNEWLMFLQTKVGRHDSTDSSSIWKLESFADYQGFNSRAHFYDAFINANDNVDLLRHGTQGPPYPDFLVNGEYPTGYNYAGTTNALTGFSDADKLAFYKSCPIYQPDYEIDSATVVIEGGTELVRLRMTGRLQHCDDAPASIPRDIGSWDRAWLETIQCRTDENSILHYLWKITTGESFGHFTGDSAMSTIVWDLPDDPKDGSIYPHFFFTKLIPFPHEDTPPNATVQIKSDTMITVDRFQQCELYLRAMCEGYIDETRSQVNGCLGLTTVPVDYTFENLCADAFGGSSITILDRAVRHVQGFGPQVNTEIAADNLNQLSACINLLTRARIMLPHRLQCRYTQYNDTETLTGDWPAGVTCAAGNIKVISFDESVSQATTVVSDSPDWEDCESVGAVSFANMLGTCDGTDFNVETSRLTAEFRYTFRDPLAINALPVDLRALVNAGGVGFIGRKTTRESTVDAIAVTTEAESAGCSFAFQDPNHFWWDSGLSVGYRFDLPSGVQTECNLFTVGALDAGSPPVSDYFFARNMGVGGAECYGGSARSIEIVPDAVQPVAFVEVPLV